jgi:hypothetical protein
MSHGEIWAIGHHQREPEEPLPDPSGQNRRLWQLQVSILEYQALGMYLHQTFGATAKRVLDYYGWSDSSRFESVFDSVGRDLAKTQ